MSPNRRRLFAALALLAACGCAAAATDGRAADFDALYQRLDDSELLTLGVADVEQRLRELDALVPADDPVRFGADRLWGRIHEAVDALPWVARALPVMS